MNPTRTKFSRYGKLFISLWHLQLTCSKYCFFSLYLFYWRSKGENEKIENLNYIELDVLVVGNLGSRLKLIAGIAGNKLTPQIRETWVVFIILPSVFPLGLETMKLLFLVTCWDLFCCDWKTALLRSMCKKFLYESPSGGIMKFPSNRDFSVSFKHL